MNFSKKNIGILAIGIFLLIFIILTISISRSKNKRQNSTVNIAFFELSENLQNQFKDELSKNNPNLTYNFINFDSSKNILEQVDKKIDLVILPQGKNSLALVNNLSEKQKNKASLDREILKGATISIQQLALLNEDLKISVLPLLVDNEEILLDLRYARRAKLEKMESLAQLTNFAEFFKNTLTLPIAFVGGDSEEFLALVSALTETFEGKDAVEKAAQMILSSGENYDMNALCSADDAPLYEATRIISSWLKNGLIKSDSFKMSKDDVKNFMSIRECAVVFTSLSVHRTVPYKVIQNFESIPSFTEQKMTFFPARKNIALRACTCPTICLVPISGTSAMKNCAEYLVSNKAQENLARSTGLAPILAQCRTPDVQSDDVRFWIASSSSPVIPLSYSAFSNSYERDKFAEELIAFIRTL